MKNKMLRKFLMFGCLSAISVGGAAQQPTSFQRLGSQDEKVQDYFPGSHRARPVMADFTNNGYMDIFYAGQDLGGSTGWYKKEKLDSRWGDLGNGKYANPILNVDYSDPDVIRVDEKYYMVASDFHFMGMQVLESEDMVNWTVISQVYSKLDFPKYYEMDRYGNGSWAPAIRYHDGKFWVYFCTPEEGLFMANAENPAGPWNSLVHVKDVRGWEDPCPLWDDNGDTYLGRSQLGGGPIIIHKMNAEGTELLDEGVTVYTGPTAEGTKMFKKDGYYYISIPEGGVSTGWQTVLRSTNIYGPYEKKVVLEQGSTKVNGPHQGALVDTPEGEWWFYHFQGTRALGRVVHLQPAKWEDGWPVVGVDYDGNGIGEPVKEYTKPNTGKNPIIAHPQTSDDFSASTLSPQWQFNHNPINGKWSLTDRSGYFTLYALKADKLRNCKNTLTQKIMGFFGEASTEIDCGAMVDGQRGGLLCIGGTHNGIGVEHKDGKNYIYAEVNGSAEQIVEISVNTVYFKIVLDTYTNKNQFYYSLDGTNYVACKDGFEQTESDWEGPRIGLYSYNTKADGGRVDFNNFTYICDGPGEYKSTIGDDPADENWHVWNELAALVKNNGDRTFSLVQEYDAKIQQSIWTNSVFFDYDNDGNLDLLLVGKGGDWRFPMSSKYALLYRNLGEEGRYMFEEVKNTGLKQECDEMYFNTISIGDYNNDGFNDILIMCYDSNGRSIDLYKNEGGSGNFTLQECALSKDGSTLGKFHGNSNGSVMFGDVDNDGWLDIFYTGYSNVSRGIRIYRNMQDGTFKDITSANIEGSFESQSVLADIDGDGDLDILVTGHGDNWARYASIYYNVINPETKMPEFTLVEAAENGIKPINKANLLIADFNNDGLMDLAANGYDGDKDLSHIFYQNNENKFILDNAQPIFSIKDGGMNMGDINGDNNMDIIIAGYKGSDTGDAYASPVRVYENTPQNLGRPNNQVPTAPASVNAVVKENRLHITWERSTDDITSKEAIRYNVYLKNNTTDELWMMIPADVTTGRVKVGTDLQTSLSSQVEEYVMNLPEAGVYTIGVQALDQAFAGSKFTTYTMNLTSIEETESDNKWIQLTSDGFIVNSEIQEDVNVFNLEGKRITRGSTNENILVEMRGVYIVNVAGGSFKLIK